VAKRPEFVAKAVGKRIRDLRKKKGWSQERLADESEMHRSYMWGVEQGRRNPSLRNLTRIANALEVALSAIFEGL
jgi:transcriptional regulator with XRE-family HTH domain